MALNDFALAPKIAIPRIVWSSGGDIGTGKTRFALTGPAPVIGLCFDRGTEGVVEEFRNDNDKDIRIKNYDWEPTNENEDIGVTKEEAIKLRNLFFADFRNACNSARTVFIDTESALWNLVRYAEFGSPKGDVPRDFDKANQLMQKYVALPKKLTINAGFLQSVKDDWSGATKKSGLQKRWGFSETPKICQVDLYHTREGGDFITTINKARGTEAKTLQDKSFKNITLPMLGMMMFPDTEEDDWS